VNILPVEGKVNRSFWSIRHAKGFIHAFKDIRVFRSAGKRAMVRRQQVAIDVFNLGNQERICRLKLFKSFIPGREPTPSENR
jgi:hypothetical protein